MIINYKCQEGILELEFTPEPGDTTTQHIFESTYKRFRKVEMGSNRCEIHLPTDWDIDDLHPDVFALAVLSIVYPFCGSEMTLPQGVSQYFHDQVYKYTKKKVLPINKTLSPRKAPSNAVPALTYSGGIDSTAAVLLLPEDTHLFYFDRIVPKGVKTLLNQEAAYYACDSMADLGKTVHKIKSDIQYTRLPVGFSTYLTDAVPALLLADYYGFDTVGHGQTLEIGYQIGHLPYKDCQETEIGDPWHPLLASIDMPYTLPTIGLSEISTTRMVSHSPYNDFAQACSRGKIKEPCMNCFKCFRKDLLEKVIMGIPLEDRYLDQLFSIKDVQRVINTKPIYFASVLAYITANYNGNHEEMLALKRETRGDILQVDWMDKWHSNSQEFLAPKYRSHIIKEIEKYAEPMNVHDVERMKQSFSEAYFNEVQRIEN